MSGLTLDADRAYGGEASARDTAAEISTRVVSVFFIYFEHIYGRTRMLQALARVGGQPDLEYLLDTGNFVSLEYCVRVAHVLTGESGDPGFLRKAGLFQLSSPRMFGFVFYIMRSLGSPQLYYRMAVKGASTYNRVCEMAIEELTDRRARLRYRSLRPEGTRLMCEGRLGQLAAAPTLWGLAPAVTREVECQSSGAPACVYEIEWIPGVRPLWRGLAGGALGAALGAMAIGGAAGVVACAAVGALVAVTAAYRADARANSRRLLDAAEAAQISLEELRGRFEEVQKLHAETAASHRFVTEEMRRREQAEAALVEAQKLEAVGQLAGGIAHDFNNILTIVLSSAAHARTRLGSPVEVVDALDAISEAGGRAADLTRRLLAFGRRQIVEPRVVAVEGCLRRIERMLRSLVGEDIVLTFDLPSEPLSALIDPGQLEQVLMNLAINARDAMPRGGRLRFALAAVELAAGQAAPADGLSSPGAYVALTVSDDGHGMDEATRRRACEPFFTTKEPGKGTGLGLATCHGIVRQAGGVLDLRSAPGQGTSVTIYLPCVSAAPDQMEVALAQRPRGGSETILVVEDNAVIRQLVVGALAGAGYRVLDAAGGRQAIALVEGGAPRISLLIADVVMEGLDGRAVAERLRALRGPLPVLFISGYAREVISRHGVLEEGLQLLPKPFTGNDLLIRVRGILDATAVAAESGTVDQSPP